MENDGVRLRRTNRRENYIYLPTVLPTNFLLLTGHSSLEHKIRFRIAVVSTRMHFCQTKSPAGLPIPFSNQKDSVTSPSASQGWERVLLVSLEVDRTARKPFSAKYSVIEDSGVLGALRKSYVRIFGNVL